MEIAVDAIGLSNDERKWARCKKCKQRVLVQIDEKQKESKITFDSFDNENTKTYSPAESFLVGDSIYHKGWDDFGIVLAKEIMSNGRNSMIVEFQKNGKKKLIETLKSNTSEER